jgi:predicted TPR repeat methyltransferase
MAVDPGGELLEEPEIPPEALFELIDESMKGLARIAVLQAAVELDIFYHLAHASLVQDLSVETGAKPEILTPLCDSLVDMGLVDRQGDRYRGTPMAFLYLSRSSPYRQTAYVEKIGRHTRDLWMQAPRILRDGPVTYPVEQFFGEMSLPAMAENALCGRLQRTVREIASLPEFPGFRRMIDLGGGHGLYAIALARANLHLTAWVFDFPYVTRLAARFIRQYRAERVHTFPGNFLTDDFGSRYDLVFSSSNPSGKSIPMVPRIADALNPGGFFVNVQSMGATPQDPYQQLEWQLWSLEGNEKTGERRTREQPFLTPAYREALAAAGLDIIREKDIKDDYHRNSQVRMVIARKWHNTA